MTREYRPNESGVTRCRNADMPPALWPKIVTCSRERRLKTDMNESIETVSSTEQRQVHIRCRLQASDDDSKARADRIASLNGKAVADNSARERVQVQL